MSPQRLEDYAARIEDRATGRLAGKGWAVLLALGTLLGFGFVAGTTFAALRWEIQSLRDTMNRRFTQLEHRVEPLVAFQERSETRRVAEIGADCALKRRSEQECLLLFSYGELKKR